MIKSFTIAFLVTLVESSGVKLAPLGAEQALGTDFEQCGQITDCFNCTLNNCAFAAGKCTGDKVGPTTFQFMLSQGKQCGDPLGACQQAQAEPSCSGDKCNYFYEEYTRTDYTYSPKMDGVFLPKGYFCTFTIP